MTGKFVLVTGGTGFIGRHVVKALLEDGATLRLVVRTQEKGDELKTLFPSYVNKIEVVVVENIETPGAFDAAVQGVDVVVHMASPLPGAQGTIGKDNETGILLPARDGTVNMLNSAVKSPSVKRVVLTSSSTAVVDFTVPLNEPRVWTDKDWMPFTWEDGKKGDLRIAYRVSKKYAEMAAWEFMEKEKPHFDLIALNAPGVFGSHYPTRRRADISVPVKRPASLKEISGSSAYLLQTLDPNLVEFPKTWSAFYIDVQDCALAHVRAAFAPVSAGNKRYLIAGPCVGTNRMIRDYLLKYYPERKVAPLSKEAEEEDVQQIFDASIAAETFGIHFRGFEDILRDYTAFAFSYEK